MPASECSIWKASSSKVSPPSRGTCTAPSACRASCSGTVSGRLERPTSTRILGPAPSAASPRARSRTATSVSAKLRVRPSQRRNGRPGVAATRRLQRSRPVGGTAPLLEGAVQVEDHLAEAPAAGLAREAGVVAAGALEGGAAAVGDDQGQVGLGARLVGPVLEQAQVGDHVAALVALGGERRAEEREH